MKTRTLTIICLLVLARGGVTSPNAIAKITDIVISAETVKNFGEMSPKTVEIVPDPKASNGLALKWVSGANNPPVPNPTAWFKVEFRADAAEYFIWIRGKSDGDTGTDALWLQFDDQIGTDKHTAFPGAEGRGLGNWRDVFDAGVYKWGSQEVPPPGVVSVKFNKAGLHTLLAQPRQVPHFIDQIWLSQDQDDRPPDDNPVKWDPRKDLRPVDPKGKIAITWGKLKQSP
ncbi:hypothetical protein HYR99_10045 [Candidatus Poribacteria bacterium]|nr:hypothetical protein [Candidatus Poribacteria bacterium]